MNASGTRMRFGVLGPVLAERDGVRIDVTSAMPRTILALLLLDADAVVSTDRLIDALWGHDAPATPLTSLQNHVMRLRRILGDAGGARILTAFPGYLIRVEEGELDLHTFTELCAAGRRHARGEQWEKASADLTAALGLWRGAPVADATGLHGQDARIHRLLEARWQAWEGRIDADLHLGRHTEVIGELRVLTAQHPVRESFHGQLMVALYRADRQAEALDTYRALRRTLADELGVEPSASVRNLQERILKADPGLSLPAGDHADPGRGRTVGAARRGPRFQLPADTRVFTGRTRELGELVDLAGGAPEGTEAGMVVISAIDGMAGIGKTALAVHAAHRVRGNFPDGQLFLDLHGYTPGLAPLTAGEALDWLLRSLGVPPELIPPEVGERAAYYRDRLDGTRTLIILDNASSAANLTGTDRRTVERRLETLLDHNLLVQHAPGRYRFHDLVRIYAGTLAGNDDPVECEAARERLLDFYQYTAQAARRHLTHLSSSGPPATVGTCTAAPSLPDRASALAWLRAEHDNMLVCLGQAIPQQSSQPDDDHSGRRARSVRVIALSWAFDIWLQMEGPYPQAVALQSAAVAAAQELGDRAAESHALWALGRARHMTGDLAWGVCASRSGTRRARPGIWSGLWPSSRLRAIGSVR